MGAKYAGMNCRISNRRWYKCSRCGAWHPGDYGIEFDYHLPGEKGDCRVGYCFKCAFEVLPTVKVLCKETIPIRQKDIQKTNKIEERIKEIEELEELELEKWWSEIDGTT